MKIWLYFTRNFFWHCIIVNLGLLALFSFLALLETLNDVGKGDFTTFHAFQIVVLTSPTRIVELLPATVVLGSLLTIGGMSNSRELLIMRAAGVSKWNFIYALSILSVIISLFCFLLFETLVPTFEKKAYELSSLTLDETAIGENEVWTRQGLSTLRIGDLSSRHIPRQIEIYETTKSGELNRIIVAEKAFLQTKKDWLLFEVRETNFSGDKITEEKAGNLVWESFLSQEQFSRLVAPPITLSPIELVKYLEQNKVLAINDAEYSSMLWKKISLPLTLIAMAILGVPMLGSSSKIRSGGHHFVAGGFVGIFFYLIEQTASNLDQLLDIPAYLSSLIPSTIIIILALVATRRTS